MPTLLPKKAALLAGAALALLLPSCENGGNFTLFGYTTAAELRTGIHTVRVKIFNNRPFSKGLEFQTDAGLIDEIMATRPSRSSMAMAPRIRN